MQYSVHHVFFYIRMNSLFVFLGLLLLQTTFDMKIKQTLVKTVSNR